MACFSVGNEINLHDVLQRFVWWPELISNEVNAIRTESFIKDWHFNGSRGWRWWWTQTWSNHQNTRQDYDGRGRHSFFFGDKFDQTVFCFKCRCCSYCSLTLMLLLVVWERLEWRNLSATKSDFVSFLFSHSPFGTVWREEESQSIAVSGSGYQSFVWSERERRATYYIPQHEWQKNTIQKCTGRHRVVDNLITNTKWGGFVWR